MPSQRRVRVFGLLAFLAILTTLYLTTSARQTRSSEFYVKTSSALRGKKTTRSDDNNPAFDPNMSTRLREAERMAKISADRKGRQLQDEVLLSMLEAEKEGTSVAGRIHLSSDKEYQVAKSLRGQAPLHVQPASEQHDEESSEDSAIEREYKSILKTSPIIVFSKSYCPYSRKAKAILLDQYGIEPAPHVVELDEHEHGEELQDLLAEKTGRRTVPNVLVGGISIGGGDEIQDLHESRHLVDTIKELGGNKIVEAKLIQARILQAPRA